MNQKFIFLISFFLLSSYAFSQSSNKLTRADDYFNEFNFLKAIRLYQKVIKKDSSNVYAMNQIGTAYLLKGIDTLANDWFQQVLTREPTNLNARFLYAITLLSKGEYDLAIDNFQQYYNQDKSNTIVNEYIEMPKFYIDLTKDSTNYVLKTLNINSFNSDYSPSLFRNYLLFTSSRDREVGIEKRKSTWTNESFLDIYMAEVLSDGSLGEPIIIGEPITTKFHEGSSTFDSMKNELYFTRTSYYEDELSYDQKGITNIEIFSSIYDELNNKWLEIVPFPYNNKEYSIAQPSISSDGKTIYFVSDMPGGIGGADIYVCYYDGVTWSEPENLGRPVNTVLNEKNPYIDSEGILYFASDGHVGLGGLDIFKAKPNSNGFNNPINMGYPVNTRFDDFSFCFANESKTSFYFSSNRDGGMGNDDVYLIDIKQEEPIILAGSVLIKESLQNTPIKMLITDTDGTLIGSDTLTKSRPFEVAIKEKEKDWNIVFYPLFEMDALESIQEVDPASAQQGIVDIGEIILGEDLPDQTDTEESLVVIDNNTKSDNKEDYVDLPNDEQRMDISFDPIYYGFDKYNLSNQAKTTLNELVKFMLADKETIVELSGNTDSRGPNVYNLYLSEKRSASVLNYLIEKGIDETRIKTFNYGELNLVNRCADGVQCSNAEHAKNRRVEIIITTPNIP